MTTLNGGIYSPGAFPGGASISSFSINGGGVFGFKVSNATGTAGTVSGWDMAPSPRTSSNRLGRDSA